MITHEEFIKRVEETYNQCADIMNAKNQDYAKDEDPFNNFRIHTTLNKNISMERSIFMHICIKIARLANSLDKQELAVKDEGITDTLMDLINYAAILKTYIEIQK